jgi:hypothetical protein
MDDIAAVRRAVDQMLLGDLGPILDLLAEDAEFCVAVGGDEPGRLEDSGKQAVVDYLTCLGGLVTFWQMDYTARGDHLIVWGRESFTIENCGLEGGCELALVLDVSEGVITRFMVVEDLPSFIRAGGALIRTTADERWSSLPGVFAGPGRGGSRSRVSQRDFDSARSGPPASRLRSNRFLAPSCSGRLH